MNENKSHYVQIKDFSGLCFKEKKKYFGERCLQCFSSIKILTEHKKVCLNINGAQSVRLEKGTTDFKNYSKEIPVPFKFYADFESNKERLEIYESFYSKKYHNHIPCSLVYNFFCVDNNFKEYEYCKKVMKKHLGKNLIMTEEEEQFK